MVRELFQGKFAPDLLDFGNSFHDSLLQIARSKKACIVFFDGVGDDNEVQRTTLEIVNQLDGFAARGNIKVLMATNRLVLLLVEHLRIIVSLLS